MIFGNPSVFAIESEITQAYERPSYLAIGFFILHVAGHCYGVRSPEATMLANSFDAVGTRIAQRGRHNAPFGSETDAGQIADAVSRALYSDCKEDELFFGMTVPQFTDALYSNSLLWAPDGDEAFDDGSHVLQFDVGNRVRLIGFSRALNPLHDSGSLQAVWLSADEFYRTLQDWHYSFQNEWASLPKEPDRAP